MNWMKRRSYLFGSFFFILGLSFVSAGPVTKIIPTQVWDILNYFFVYLPGNSTYKYVYFKFLMWMLVFTLLKAGTKRLSWMEGKTGNIVSLIISLMATLLMPNGILEYVFRNYAFLASVFAVLLPAGLIYYVNYKLIPSEGGWKFVRGLVWILTSVFAFSGAAALSSEFANTPLPDWLSLVGIICLIAGVFTLLTGWGGASIAGRVLGGGREPHVTPKSERQLQKEAEETKKDLEEKMQEIKDSEQIPLTIKNHLLALGTRIRRIQEYNSALGSIGSHIMEENARLALEEQTGEWPTQYWDQLKSIVASINTLAQQANATVQALFADGNYKKLNEAQAQNVNLELKKLIEDYFKSMSGVHGQILIILQNLVYNTVPE